MSETNIFYERNSYWTVRTNIGTIIVKLQFYRDGQNTSSETQGQLVGAGKSRPH